ncbi:helix-turn-helix domain-containing protein [Embleya sp. NPDC001921]
MLEPFGISAADEELYRELLGRPDLTLAELAEALATPPQRLRRQLKILEDAGLVSRAPGRPIRFRPAPPGLAVDVLAARQHERLEHSRLDAVNLNELWETGRGREPAVQIVRGNQDNVARFLHTQRTARREILTFDKPPYVAQGVTRQTELQLERLAAGVRYRTLYDSESLTDPAQVEAIRALAHAGEQARTTNDLPMKALIADGTSGLVPIALSGERHTVVLGPSPLLDGLITLFELLWQTATPLWSAGPTTPQSALSAFDTLLLGYAAAGCTDEVTARRTGLNKRTIERHMRRVMDTLGARTRFQAGLQAGLKGYLG